MVMIPLLKIPSLIHHLTDLQTEASKVPEEGEVVVLARLEVMAVLAMPYEMELECSFCSLSVEPILDR